jgi:Ser/Thr protein kinase RdoA (MazF antagonist)
VSEPRDDDTDAGPDTGRGAAVATAATPYADLDPDNILGAVESLGLRADGRVLALNSYENRVYRIGLEDGAPVVAKFYRPGRWTGSAIVEEHAFADELVAADLSVVAPLRFGRDADANAAVARTGRSTAASGRSLHNYHGHRFALFPLRGGHAPEPGDKETLLHLGRVLGRLHAVGDDAKFAHRGRLDVDTHGHDPVDFLLDNDWLPDDIGENFATLADALLETIEDRFDALPDLHTLRLHGDCHPGNILWRDDQAHFVDLDDCLTGPAVQDLWMLAGRREDSGKPLRWLLEGYEEFRRFDRRELALIEPLRALRLLHFNGWIARRWQDPAFPVAFPMFEERRYWESVIGQMQEQLAAMAEPVVKPD